jgi:hypothetical protein
MHIIRKGEFGWRVKCARLGNPIRGWKNPGTYRTSDNRPGIRDRTEHLWVGIPLCSIGLFGDVVLLLKGCGASVDQLSCFLRAARAERFELFPVVFVVLSEEPFNFFHKVRA